MPVLEAETVQLAAYQKLEKKVQDLMAKGIRLKMVSLSEAIAVLFLFSQSTDIYDLETFVEIFAESFPFLRQLVEEKEFGSKTDMETKVRSALEKIVKIDPIKASLITQRTLQPGITWDELVHEFPELEQ